MTQDEVFSTLRSAGIYISGIATGVGVLAASVGSIDVQTDIQHMIHGAKEFMVGLGPLIAIALGWWAKIKSSLPSKVADVHAAQPGALVAAVQEVLPVVLRDAVAAQPDVKSIVVTSKAAADASPSAKVTS